VTDDGPTDARRRVRRGEGEVTEWPRGLVDYTPTGAPDAAPSPDEDRDLNRLRIASRLLSLARSRGLSVDRAVVRLRDADRALQKGDRRVGRQLVDGVIDEVEALLGEPPGEAEKPSS